ncbi:MAG: lysophospholipid acyltransferase family protein [Myxococcota bacterium]
MIERLARAFLRGTGWETEGGRPLQDRFVLIAAPHTSNWDLAYLLAMASTFELRISWMGKSTLFRGPMGSVMRRLGGVPVERSRRTNMVDALADEFARRDQLALVVPAEGTRSYTAHWKSGFYHIARTANVPIVMGYLDYTRKRGGFGPALLPTGDIRADMDQIRDFYGDKQGKYPECFGEIRLKEEM